MTTAADARLATLVGQSMMFRFEGPTFTDEARAAFATMRPGGVILFGDNITSRAQIHTLTSDLQQEAKRLGLPPLLIAIDQEGGIVSRFSPDMVTVPGAMALTANGDLTDIRRSAEITAEQLASVGVNVNFAPVVDVNNNPENPVIRTRSYADTVERVTDGALATIAGFDAHGIVSTVKHFPGHGDTAIDSHKGLPVIAHPRARLDAIELAPFRAAIAADVPGVMTTHILFPDLDDAPATLSRAILTDLLRGELGFDGVIFTDSLSMNAIEEHYGHGDAAIHCKLSGVDMLEANEPIAHQLTRVEALVNAAADGTIPEGIFTATNARLDALRARFGLTHDVPPLTDADPAWQRDAERIAAQTIVVDDPSSILPIAPGATLGVIDFQRLRSSEAEDPFNRAGVLRDAIAASFPAATTITMHHDPTDNDLAAALITALTVDVLVIATRDATENAYQVELARQLIAGTRPGTTIVHVALRGPYDRGILGDIDATIFTFGDPAVTLRVLPQLLAASTPSRARMPLAHLATR